VAQIDRGKGDEMSAKEISISPLETYQKSLEFIDPGESSFRSKAMFVDFRVE